MHVLMTMQESSKVRVATRPSKIRHSGCRLVIRGKISHVFTDVLDGYNGTVFAYGQTGSGKTFTMMVSASPGLIDV